jgi:hypothetical protein
MSDKHVHIKDKYISKAIELADKLLDVSVSGTKEAGDDSSMIFFGTIRDYAFKIKKLADELLKKRQEHN